MKPWFKSCGWLYCPISIMGWIVTILPILFIINVFMALNRNAHSVTDLLYPFFLYFMTASTLWYWIACHSSKK